MRKLETCFDVSREIDNYIKPGIQHKYKQTLAVIASDQCYSVCEWCFRKRIFNEETLGNDKIANLEDVLEAVKDPGVTSLLLTGYDAIYADPDYLLTVIRKSAKHVSSIRVASRAIALDPKLLDKYWLREVMTKTEGVAFHFITHILTTEELKPKLKEEIAKFPGYVQFKCQTPLLKGVNLEPKVLASLWESLNKFGILPYYCFQCRPVKGNEHYIATFKETIECFEQAKALCSGVDKTPKLIMSCSLGKAELIGLKAEKALIKFHQARFEHLTNKMFLVDANKHWIFENNLEEFGKIAEPWN